MSVEAQPLQDAIILPSPPGAHVDVTLGWIPAWMMTADHPYQRPQKKFRVERMKSEWADDLFGAISVIEVPKAHLARGTNVRYWIIEGGHRHATAMERFGASYLLPCTIVSFKSGQRSGEIFLGMNGANGERRGVARFDQYKVGSNAELEPYRSINALLAKYDLTYGPNQAEKQIGATKQLVDIYNNWGPETLRRTIEVIIAAWPEDKTAWTAAIMRAIADIIGINEQEEIPIDYSRLTERLMKKAPVQWMNLGISKHAKSGGGSTSRGAAVAKVIVEAYNRESGGRFPMNRRLVNQAGRRRAGSKGAGGK